MGPKQLPKLNKVSPNYAMPWHHLGHRSRFVGFFRCLLESKSCHALLAPPPRGIPPPFTFASYFFCLILFLLPTFSGDRLHFGLAAEQAKAEGLRVEMVVVGEDVAIEEPGLAGRRGLAGTALVHKVGEAGSRKGKWTTMWSLMRPPPPVSLPLKPYCSPCRIHYLLKPLISPFRWQGPLAPLRA